MNDDVVRIYAIDEHGRPTEDVLTSFKPASNEAVQLVLSQPEGDLDGRSKFYWFRLQNGDLILGVFPQGKTYFAVEEDERK